MNRLTEEQSEAFHGIFNLYKDGAHAAILNGEAGCGKTFTLARIIARCRAEGISFAASALTHKAAGVLNKTLEDAGVHQKASTAHSLFKMSADRENPDGSIPASRVLFSQRCFIVVDEASMMGLPESNIIMEAIERSNAFVLFVGDDGQLRPVVADASSRERRWFMFTKMDVPVFTLKTPMRFNAEGGIADVARALRRFEGIQFQPFQMASSPEVSSLRDSDRNKTLEKYVLKAAAGDVNPEEERVICWLHATVNSINQAVLSLKGRDEHSLEFQAGDIVSAQSSVVGFVGPDDRVYGYTFREKLSNKLLEAGVLTEDAAEDLYDELANHPREFGSYPLIPNNASLKLESCEPTNEPGLFRLTVRVWVGHDLELPFRLLGGSSDAIKKHLRHEELEHARAAAARNQLLPDGFLDEYDKTFRTYRDFRQMIEKSGLPDQKAVCELERVRRKKSSTYNDKKRMMLEVLHGYAGTIHKAQGSGADHVIVVPDFPSLARTPTERDRVKRLLYTGVTRARSRVSFAAMPRSLTNSARTLSSTEWKQL